MNNSEEIFNGLGKDAFKSYMDSQNENNKGAETRLMLILIGVFAFVGAEAVRLVFRKGFGREGINLIRVIICFICFGALAVLSFTDHKNDWAGSPDSFIVTGVLYSALAVYVLIKGISEWYKADDAKDFRDYRGDSSVLQFLIKDGWEQKNVQRFAEPVLVLAIGFVMFLLYNKIAGIGIMACAASVWIQMFLERIFITPSLFQQTEKFQQQSGDSEEFFEI